MAAVSPLPKDGVNPSHQQNAGEKMPDKPTTATAAPADTAITTRATSSYLLLRLFTSGFFNSWLAVSYLFRYPHSVGIQHYLCNELRKFPIEEVEFFLPQLVHLLLTRPNESIALESLLLDLSIRSSHIAILFYWHLNAYFHDMKGNPRTASFKLCQRTINQLQLILFVDDTPDLLCDSPAPVRNAFMRFAQSTRSRLNNLASTALDWRRAVSFQLAPRVRENAVATLVGMSGVLAGFGSPAIGQCMGALAIAQSRRGKISDAASTADPDICIGGAQRSLDGGDTWHRPSEDSAEDDTPDSSEILEREGGPLKQRPSFPSRQSRASPKDSLLYIESDSEVSSRSHRLGSATTKGGGVRTSSKVSRTLKSAPSDPTPDAASACRDYDKLYLGKVTNYLRHQKKWLGYRSNYFQNEIQFMTGLMDISRRVCLVPKASRQNSLKAELAFFNQHLKEDMCVPLWCSNHKNSMKHQRIVRIPLDDVVVLNSAERAPYLLMLEVIEADSDEEYVPPAPKKPVSPRTERPKSMEPSLPSVGHSSTLSARAVGATEPRFATVGSGSRAKRQPRNMESAVGATSATESSRQESHKNSPIRQQQQQQQGSSGNYHKANARPPTSTTHRALTSDEEGGQAAAEEKHPHDPELDTLMEAFGDINLGGEVLNPAPLARMTRDAHGWADQQPPPSSPTNYAPAHSSSAWSRDSSKRDGILISPLRPGFNNTGAASASSTRGMDHDTEREPETEEEISERMRTAAMLLAQLARMQKGLGRSKQVYTTVAGESSTAASSSTSANNSDQAVGAPERKSRRRGGAHAQAADTVEKIRENLINEMMRLENKRFQLQQARLKAQREQQRQTPATAASKSDSSEGLTGMASDQVDLSAVEYKDDPSAKVLKEDWEQKKARIRTSSPYGHEPRWNLISVIVKEGADLRQEQLALQLIREMGRVWQLENVPVFIRYFRIMVTGEQSGLIETITNTISVHSLKKDFYNRNPDYTGPPFTLFEYFRAEYGEPDTPKYQKAQDNFMRSLVAYSLATYILQLRDRHNGNILLDTEGHLIHIDFGFMLSNSPGSVGFEAAPFKMPQEYVQVLGGMGSPKWREFKGLLRQAFMVLRKYVDNFCLLVEMMLKDSKLPCLSAGPAAVTTMRDRFQLTMTDKQVDEFLDRLLLSSCDNITTRMYDLFQYYSNGIL